MRGRWKRIEENIRRIEADCDMPLREVLIDLYYSQRLSTHTIGRMLRTTKTTVRNWMMTFGLPLRSVHEGKAIRMRDPDVREKLSLATTRKWRVDPGYRGRVSRGTRKGMADPAVRKKISDAQKRVWGNPEYKAAHLHRIRNGLNQRPNKWELRIHQILVELFGPDEWKYVGDGSILIDGLNPDFINVNGKKLIIEFFGEPWHTDRLGPINWRRTEEGRKTVFASFGYRTLVIWDRELNDLTDLKQRVVSFAGGD